MVKKVLVTLIIALVLVSNFSIAFAVTKTENLVETEAATELYEIKENVGKSLEEYKAQYGSPVYGVAAYILNTVRIYSFPFCFVGIAVGAIYQYVLGIRKLDVRDKGMALIVTFVTLFLICQVLPFIFAIVVNGWRG